MTRTEKQPVNQLAAALQVDGLSRRRFLRLCGGAVAAVSASALIAACAEEEYSEPEVAQVSVGADEIPAEGEKPLHSEEGRFYLIHNENGLLALSTKCTHKGCVVGWEGDENEFHCPCHGSVYDRHGVNIDGPAPRPLDLVKIEREDDGGIMVLTDSITEREQWKPEQAFPTSG